VCIIIDLKKILKADSPRAVQINKTRAESGNDAGKINMAADISNVIFYF
jgi:hypothetical protein